jgi:RNA polymerase sigma-70 factor, ECF subfamily
VDAFSITWMILMQAHLLKLRSSMTMRQRANWCGSSTPWSRNWCGRTVRDGRWRRIFAKLFQKLSQFSGSVPIEHWVSRIAINTCLNQIEAERIRPEVRYADLSDAEVAVVERLAASSEELAPDKKLGSQQLVEHFLAALKPVERLVIDLLYLQGRSVAEIKKLTGWSTALVKVRAFRARQKMKKQLSRISVEENQ